MRIALAVLLLTACGVECNAALLCPGAESTSQSGETLTCLACAVGKCSGEICASGVKVEFDLQKLASCEFGRDFYIAWERNCHLM